MKKGINTIKLFRTLHGFTPKSLSEKSGIPRWVIFEYEHGYRPVSDRHWAILSKIFGFDAPISEEKDKGEENVNP